MSVAPFAQLEARLNSAIERRLANVEVVHAGGEPFGAVLDRAASDPFGGAVDATQLTLGLNAARVPGLVEGADLLVAGVLHTVTGPVQPDAFGWLSLRIYPKA